METGRKPKLLLIDGFNLAFRCFYAVPQTLETKNNVPVNALYGFLRAVISLLEHIQPDSLAICLDAPAKTFRSLKDENYKAQRKATPPSLLIQLKLLTQDLLPSLALPQLMKEGFEADDLIASLVKRFHEKYEVFIYSNDSDLFQLLNQEHIQIILPSSPVNKLKSYTRADFIRDYEIMPDQYCLYKAMVGDSSDNIKGIMGIGPKTSIRLIKIYKSLDNILQDKTAQTLKIRQQEELLRHNLEMIALVNHLANEIHEESLHFQALPSAALSQVVERYEFHSLLKRAAISPNQSKTEGKLAPEHDAVFLQELDPAELQSLLLVKKWSIYWNTEEQKLFFYHAEKGLYYCFLTVSEKKSLPDLYARTDPMQLVLSMLNSANQIICFEIKKLLHWLSIPENTVTELPLQDVQLMFYLLFPNLRSYDIHEYLLRYSQDASKNPAILLWESWDLINTQLQKEDLQKVYMEIERPLLAVLYGMEAHGIKISDEVLIKLKETLTHEIAKTRENIYQQTETEFNIASPKQLAFVLFEKMKLPAIKKTKTGYSTNSEVLDILQPLHPVIGQIKIHREYSKLLNTYVMAFMQKKDPQSQLHTTFLQAGPSTGRISSIDPNLQNLPSDTKKSVSLKSVFIPSHEDWFFISADYSQIDLRVLAHFSEDPHLMNSFINEEDIHTQTAKKIFHLYEKDQVSESQRRTAKAINFGIIYGMSSFGLSRSLKVSENEASEMIKRYFSSYPKVAEFREYTIEKAKQQGYVETLTQRKRPIPELKSNNKQLQQLGERLAVNTIIQGTSADIIKLAMIQMHSLLLRNPQCFLLLQIHDELIWECEASQINELIKLARNKMEHAVSLKIPLKVHFKKGLNLSDLRKMDYA